MRASEISSVVLNTAATGCQVHIGGTFLEVDGEDFYNTFVLVGPQGNVLGTVRKSKSPSFESFFIKEGGFAPHVVDTDIGAVGIAICYEAMLTAIPRLFVAKYVLLLCWRLCTLSTLLIWNVEHS